MKVWWMTIIRAMGNSYLDLKHRKVIAQGWPYLGDLSTLVKDFDNHWLKNLSQVHLPCCRVFCANHSFYLINEYRVNK